MPGPAVRRRAAPLYHLEQGTVFHLPTAQVDGDGAVAARVEPKDEKAHKLAEDGGQGGSRHPHIEAPGEDENRVQDHVQDTAGGDAHHGVGSASRETKQVIEAQGSHHVGSTDENVPGIVHGKGTDGVGSAQQIHKRFQEKLPQKGKAEPHEHPGEEAGGGHGLSLLPLLLAQQPGGGVSRPVAEGKADGLDHRHKGKHHTHRPLGAFPQGANKISVGHVINGCNEHTDDGGHRQAAHQAWNGSRGEPLKFFLRVSEFWHGIFLFFLVLIDKVYHFFAKRQIFTQPEPGFSE